MGKFAPVAPIRILDQLAQNRQIGPYHLLLAHDIIANTEAYDIVFNKSRTGYSTIILDNSVIELGGAVDLTTIVIAAKAVNPTVIVLPDVLMDAKATYESIKAALPLWIPAFEQAKLQRDYSFMIVPQGSNVNEFVECATKLGDLASLYSGIVRFWWGIPRNFLDIHYTRQTAVNICSMISPGWPIHMLGFSNNLVDDFTVCRSNKEIWGIDSAVPLRAASQGIKFSLHADPGPRGDWWDTCRFMPEMIDNIKIARNFASGC